MKVLLRHNWPRPIPGWKIHLGRIQYLVCAIGLIELEINVHAARKRYSCKAAALGILATTGARDFLRVST